MRQTPIIRPDYADRFACIGPACEDTCCAGWSVSVDETTYRTYTDLPAGSLRSLIDSSIVLTPTPPAGTAAAASFAGVRMLPSGVCPFLSEERLCRIQVEHGESYLCHTCATFPRTTHTIDKLKETKLSLSCPEAARLVLLAPRLLPPPGASRYRMTWDETATQPASLRNYFWQIRAFALSLTQNRAYPLWQRLFLLGTLSRRLEALARGELSRSFPELLDGFSRALATRGLCASMETILANLPLQLEIVLWLITRRMGDARFSPRLREVLRLFAEGVGHARGVSIESQAANYAEAYAQYYAPFFRKRPYILENYLINAILRDLFPFGQKLFDPEATPEPARAFALLAVQFALIKGLLIGVAGARKEKFSSADAIRTVQIAFKHFEHNHRFVSEALAMLAERGLDDAPGLTMLLRN